jgi:hypothetical protein
MSNQKLSKSYIRRMVASAVAGAVSVAGCTLSAQQKDMVLTAAQSPVEEVVVDDNFISPLQLAITGTTTTSSTTTTETSTTTSSMLSIITTTATTTVGGTTDVVTSTTSAETTETVTEASTEEEIETSEETAEDTVERIADAIKETKVESVREYTVYKPSTHYIHRSTCRWFNSECVEIDSTEGLEARRCSECKPDMEIETVYVEPEPELTDTAIAVTDYEYTILCNLVAGEYGSDWVSTYDKGAVVATVIHRMWEGTRWTNGAPASIYNVIASPYQYDGKYLSGSYSSRVTQSCKDAVTYALNNMSAYDWYTNPDGTTVYMINSFRGDGTYNWFRCS